MIEGIVDQDLGQEPVLIETGLDVLSIENMIILQKTVEFTTEKRVRTKTTNVYFR